MEVFECYCLVFYIMTMMALNLIVATAAPPQAPTTNPTEMGIKTTVTVTSYIPNSDLIYNIIKLYMPELLNIVHYFYFRKYFTVNILTKYEVFCCLYVSHTRDSGYILLVVVNI